MENKKETYDILNSFKTKTEAYKYFGISTNSNGILELNKLSNSVGFDLNIYKLKRNPKRYCLNCNKELTKGQKKFCSTSCSTTYNNTGRILDEKTKNNIRLGRIKYNNEHNVKK